MTKIDGYILLNSNKIYNYYLSLNKIIENSPVSFSKDKEWSRFLCAFFQEKYLLNLKVEKNVGSFFRSKYVKTHLYDLEEVLSMSFDDLIEIYLHKKPEYKKWKPYDTTEAYEENHFEILSPYKDSEYFGKSFAKVENLWHSFCTFENLVNNKDISEEPNEIYLSLLDMNQILWYFKKETVWDMIQHKNATKDEMVDFYNRKYLGT